MSESLPPFVLPLDLSLISEDEYRDQARLLRAEVHAELLVYHSLNEAISWLYYDNINDKFLNPRQALLISIAPEKKGRLPLVRILTKQRFGEKDKETIFVTDNSLDADDNAYFGQYIVSTKTRPDDSAKTVAPIFNFKHAIMGPGKVELNFRVKKKPKAPITGAPKPRNRAEKLAYKMHALNLMRQTHKLLMENTVSQGTGY